ncbi:MAG: hypothetical protein ACFWT7_07635 [Succiniclasticum sp.]|jgi:cation transport ATPase
MSEFDQSKAAGTAAPSPVAEPPHRRDRKQSRAVAGEWARFRRAWHWLVPLLIVALTLEVLQTLAVWGLAAPWLRPPALADRHNPWGLVELLLFLPIAWTAREFYRFAWKDIRKGIPSPEVLVTVSTAASVIMGIYTAVQMARGIPYEVLPPLFFLYSGICLTAALGANALDRWGKVPLPSFRDRPALVLLSGAILLAIVAFLSFFFTGRHSFPLWQIVGSLLVLACPAGLLPATSLPAFVAAWHTARQHILLRDGTVLGDFYRTTMFVFSKTGTMTRDQVKLTDFFPFHQAPETGLLGLAAAMVQGADSSEARAVREAAEGCPLPPVTELKTPPSGGFETLCFHERVRLGTKEYISRFLLLPSESDAYADRLTGEGKTVWYLTVGRRLYAIMGFSDTLREEVPAAMEALKAEGVRTAVMTGDNRRSGQYLGKLSGADKVAAELAPEDKASLIRTFQAGGDILAAVGHGSDDALALATADTGIALGSGDKAAWQAAQVVLLDDGLRHLPWLLRLSRRCTDEARHGAWVVSLLHVLLVPAACGILTLFDGPMLTLPMLLGTTVLSFLYLAATTWYFKKSRI